MSFVLQFSFSVSEKNQLNLKFENTKKYENTQNTQNSKFLTWKLKLVLEALEENLRVFTRILPEIWNSCLFIFVILSITCETFSNSSLKRRLHITWSIGNFEHSDPRQPQNSIFIHDIPVSWRNFAGFCRHFAIWTLNLGVSVSSIVPRFPIQSVN